MGPRTLEGRLTRRTLVGAGAVLSAVALVSVTVTDRELDAADSGRALGAARVAADALEHELREGDTLAEAISEVGNGSAAEGARIAVLRPAGAPPPPQPLPALSSGSCATVTDHDGAPWRACAAEGHDVLVVASVAIGDHRSTVRTLARSMLSVVALAVLVLWLTVRASVRGALQELLALVGWTASVARSDEMVSPPAAHTEEVAKLSSAFDALVRRLFEALARERASSAHIAHELRTPLTAMVAELESLRLEDKVAAAAVARVRSDVSRLADVVDAILVLSTRQGPSAADGIVNVADLVRDLAPQGVRVNAPDEALVHGDERLLALAIRNLLENAQKHAGGPDAIHVDRADVGVQIAVSDRGPGLDASARARMFDRYWRHGAEVEGRGLGLALVRAVAERHAGAARAEPGPGGKGLTVSMTVSGLVGWHEVSRRSLSDR